jgi:hypothetical protein
MTTLMLKFNGNDIQLINSKGWFSLPDGRRVSPAYAGWKNEDGYSLVEYVPPPSPEPTPEQILAQQIEAVKAEAMRRILEICPEWKQRNLTAQAAILAEKGRANWSAEELSNWNAGKAIWDQIAAIRECSDIIELMDPIPEDFTENKYWE